MLKHDWTPAFCVRGAQGHFGRPICTPTSAVRCRFTPTSAVRCRFRLLATLLLVGLPPHTNSLQTHPPATQLSYSRSRVPGIDQTSTGRERGTSQHHAIACYERVRRARERVQERLCGPSRKKRRGRSTAMRRVT